MNDYIANQRVKKNPHDRRLIQFVVVIVVLTLHAVLDDVEHNNMYSVLAPEMHLQVSQIPIVLLLVVKR